MFSNRLCRACRLRILGPQCFSYQTQYAAQSHLSNSKHVRHIGTFAVAATGTEISSAVPYCSRFSQASPPDLPVAHPGLSTADYAEGEDAVVGTKKREKLKQRHQPTNTPTNRQRSRSQVEDERKSLPRKAGHKKPSSSGNRSAGGTSNSHITKKKRRMIPAGARPNIPLDHVRDGTATPSRNVYSDIRRRWNIPAERSPAGFQKHHERTAAYLPILSQQYKQWGYLRHRLSEFELPEARKAFDRWYRRLGLILVEPHRLKERTSWRNEASWLLEYSSAPAMCSAWTKIGVEERRRLWPGIMLSAILISPSRAVDVLAATMSPLPPGYAITDVLQFVAQNLARHWPSSHRERIARADEIVHLMEEVLVHTPQGHLRPTQITFGILAKLLPPSHAKEIHDMLKRAEMPIHENTALHFASTLSQSLEFKQSALDILIESARKGSDLNGAKFTSVITSLLHCRPKASSDTAPPDTAASFSKKALEELMEHGLVPNVINLTAFLQSLCWDGELDEAIRLALLFSESGAKLDNRTFNTVFKAAKESRDPEKMRQALDVAKAAKAPIVNVLNNVLHAVFYTAEVEQRDAQASETEGHRVFDSMLRLYAQRFDLEPLQWLLPKSLPLLLAKDPVREESVERQTALSVAKAFFRENQLPKLEPDVTTLSTMLRAYVRSLQHPYDVVSFYEFFKFKLESDEEEGVNYARALVQKHNSLIHDTVILAMLDHRLSTRQLLHVLGDMLRDNLPAKAAQIANDDAVKEDMPKPVHPVPTLFTLSILISRLLVRRETMVAKQLMDVMREHGIEPNLETWNAMVKGYAVLQDVPQTVSMLQRLEAAGYMPDNYTFQAFGKLRNQTQALNLMDNIIRQNEARLAREEVY